jgi:TPR repeat protein
MDYSKAAAWYRMAAEQGDAEAQFRLGRMSYLGQGVPRDYNEAVRWYRMAAEQGDPQAQYNLGALYESGPETVPRDLAEAAKWYRKAAGQGFGKAQHCLGFLYEHGEGVPQDDVLAYMWYHLAASRFPPTATYERDTAARDRDHLAARMTSVQIDEARRLAREWMPKTDFSPQIP